MSDLIAAVCPECLGKGTLVERDRQTKQRRVLGVNEDDEIEYGEVEYLDGGDCYLLCMNCWSEMSEEEVVEVTFDRMEDDDA